MEEKFQWKEELWKKCVEFHGHECGGLMIGFRAALYVMELFDFSRSEDEELVCVTENDACGVDAIQVLLGCSVGKGNLLFRLRGKQAFRFYHRKTHDAVRLVLRETGHMSREEKMKYMKNSLPRELFEVQRIEEDLPVKARIFRSVKCECCGEVTAENMIRLQDGKQVCLDCYDSYTRFL